MKVSSLPFGSETRTIRNRSASLVVEETKSLAAIGPVISVGRSAVIEKVTPFPRASYWTLPACLTGVGVNAMAVGSR